MTQSCGPNGQTGSGCGVGLTPEQRRILHEHGTERPGSSPLNDEKRAGTYACAACGRSLFSSETKYDRAVVGRHFSGLWLEASRPRRIAATAWFARKFTVRTARVIWGMSFPMGRRPRGFVIV